MDKHYQEIVDEVFGSYYPHRTLRTLFDLHSSEWNETTVEEKLGILKRILSSNKISLSKLIVGYKHFYTKELSNKGHAVDSIQDALVILLQNAI